jgi:alpha-L-fucosidase
MLTQWFREAKLGIFIHWGIYSAGGVGESWPMFNRQISRRDYMAMFSKFTASKYDPKAWATLFRRAGARYVVLTAKHHDGVALWDTSQNDLSVVKGSPAGRDLIAPYCEALRAENLRVGLYYSHIDWSHPDYPSVPCPGYENVVNEFNFHGTRDETAWTRFLKFHRGQLTELLSNYGRIDLLWFDGSWERHDEDWKMKELRNELHALQSEVVLNGRVGAYGDYETPEQAVPIFSPKGAWEFCMTMNDNWGYIPQDNNFKSTRQIIQYFCDCISRGGNLLLDVGPKEDGTFQEEVVSRLEELGEWTTKHAEAIYPTVAGMPLGHFWGPSTLSKDRTVLYLFVHDKPYDVLAVKGLHNAVKRVTALGHPEEMTHQKIGGAPWAKIPGVLWIDVPEKVLDPKTTVLKLELEGPLDLYRGGSGAIEQN